VLGGLYFAKRWRRARVITPVQFLETRYNGFLRQLFAWAGIPMKIFDDALKIFATGVFVSLAAGVNLQVAIVVCGVVMIAYTFFGGLWALVVTDYVQFLMKALAILLMLPLAIIAVDNPAGALAKLPPGMLHPVNGPYGWIYIAGFVALMMVSYNASWSLAQKYYSVRDEHEASKAAFCSAALNLVGAPLMIFPAVLARHILPDLVAQGRTADVYVLLVMKLLPAGMVGIIMAAMFSATMAMVSADFNAIAGVLTTDVYQRLFRQSASDSHLLSVGRWTTFGLGAVTTLLSLWIAYGQQQSLFNMMVTVMGLFMAPTFLPLLAGLTVRRLSWPGALAGFLGGLATGAAMLMLKIWWAPAQTIFGSVQNFEGVTLLANTAATMLGMLVGTLLFPRTIAEVERVDRFFDLLDEPIRPEEAPKKQTSPAGPILGLSTISVGVLLWIAAAISNSSKARIIDLSVGLILIAIGIVSRRDARNRASRLPQATVVEP